MVVNVGFAQVFVLGVLVWQMRVLQRRVVMFVGVRRGQVLPFAQHLVGALPTVVSHVWVLMVVHNRLMRVLFKAAKVSVRHDLK
jgi:hypothetical protein